MEIQVLHEPGMFHASNKDQTERLSFNLDNHEIAMSIWFEETRAEMNLAFHLPDDPDEPWSGDFDLGLPEESWCSIRWRGHDCTDTGFLPGEA